MRVNASFAYYCVQPREEAVRLCHPHGLECHLEVADCTVLPVTGKMIGTGTQTRS